MLYVILLSRKIKIRLKMLITNP